MRLDLLRDILLEPAAALPADRAARVAIAIGKRLTQRLGNMEMTSAPTTRWCRILRRYLRPCTARMRTSNRAEAVLQ